MSDKILKPEEARISRRDLIKGLGVAAAGFAAGQLVNTPLALGQDVYKQTFPMPFPSSITDDDIKYAVAWAGWRYGIGHG